MVRLRLFAEGQTEQTFANTLKGCLGREGISKRRLRIEVLAYHRIRNSASYYLGGFDEIFICAVCVARRVSVSLAPEQATVPIQILVSSHT